MPCTGADEPAHLAAAYVRQTKDSELIQYASLINVRTERGCRELLRDSAKRRERGTPANHGRGIQASVASSDTRVPTLSDIGLTLDQSSRYQQMAAAPTQRLHNPTSPASNVSKPPAKVHQHWCRQSDSNRRPTAYKAVALPTELCRHWADCKAFARPRRAPQDIAAPCSPSP